MFGLDFHVFSIFCLHRALYKIHSWNPFAHEKIKSERKSVVKKEKKKETGPKKKESTILSRRETELVYESDWYWRSSWRTEKSPSNQNLLCMMLKTRFSFVCKYQPWYKTVINDKRMINKFSNDILSTQRET